MTGIMSVYISMICIYIQEWPTKINLQSHRQNAWFTVRTGL